MASEVEIKCINKSERYNPHERITHVGGGVSGQRWWLTQEDAIDHIEADRYRFYVSVGGDTAWVIVAKSQYGNKYLKTENDGEEPNNLLSLPACPRM